MLVRTPNSVNSIHIGSKITVKVFCGNNPVAVSIEAPKEADIVCREIVYNNTNNSK